MRLTYPMAALGAAVVALSLPGIPVPRAAEPLFTDQLTGAAIDPRLDPQAREIATAAARSGGLPKEMTAKRLAFDRVFTDLGGAPEPVASVEDRLVPAEHRQVPVRLYRSADGPLPVVVYTHGGGFEKGSLASHDAPLRRLANRCGCAVVAVDYALAPEHKFPSQTDDAFGVLRWVAVAGASAGLDPARIAVMGDSVGGNLAAVSAIRARDAGEPKLALQVLLYPVTDVTLSSESWHQFAKGPWLTRDYEMNALNNQYLTAGQDPKDPLVSPLYARVEGLPPALVINAEFDGYRDEGQAYADRLTAAGIPAVAKVWPGQIHDFFLMTGKVDAARAVVDEVAGALRRAFGNAS